MNLIPWKNKRSSERTELAPVGRLRAEMDRLFDNFFREGIGDGFDRLLAPVTGHGPMLDVTEDEKSITVKADLPGVEPADIDVRVSGDLLTICGEKKEEHEEKRAGYRHTERRFGSFQRSVRLPGEVDPDKVEAEYRHGVLTIRMERAPGTVRKRIAVSKTAE